MLQVYSPHSSYRTSTVRRINISITARYLFLISSAYQFQFIITLALNTSTVSLHYRHDSSRMYANFVNCEVNFPRGSCIPVETISQHR